MSREQNKILMNECECLKLSHTPPSAFPSPFAAPSAENRIRERDPFSHTQTKSKQKSTIMQLFFFLFIIIILNLSLHPSLSLNQEGLFLLQSKQSLDDPNLSLSNWNPRDPTPCNWTGITCSPSSSSSSSSSSAVTSIDLSNLYLSGPFPSRLCKLPSLTSLSLSYNFINSTLPSSSLLSCSSLTHLDLSQNLLVGPLPSSLSSLPLLSYLDLSANNFSGSIPASFAYLPKLQSLSLVANLLTSPIPAFLSNISSLRQLNLSYNPFSPGPIPSSFGNLSSLEVLWLAGCNLIGPIPPSLGQLSALTDLDLSSNALSGSIPSSILDLRSAVQIELYDNSLSGSIPSGFSNIKSLRRIDFSMNHLSGKIPEDVFLVPLLESLHLYENNLSGSVPATVSSSAKLSGLRLFSNRLSGQLPGDLGSKSPLSFVDLSDNLISGVIPASICDGGVLEEILLLDNQFSGSIPESLGKCHSLTRVRLLNNRLSGSVPAGFWGLPHVSLLELAGNELSGQISSSIANAANLSKLLISNNQFSGQVPPEIGALSNLYEISAANNRLTGPLPAEIAKLGELERVDLHNNSISGEIPSGIESWKKLNQLNLADNELTGGVPPELGDLPVLNYLDISGNLLTGQVPFKLQNLKLNQLNLSNNQLSGALPPLFRTLVYRESFLGNPGLCPDLTGMCTNSRERPAHGRGSIWLLKSMFILSVLFLFIGVFWFYWRYRSFKKAKQRLDRSKWTLTSFHKLGFSEYEILDCIDEDNVIGRGASGKVYKAVLSNGEAVAVKKLWGSAKKDEESLNQNQDNDDGFEAEVETLGKIRHKNIVKLWCCCSHKDCKLLVYEFMPNGSLGDLLHSNKSGMLDWPMRYRIALDAAEGLCYLHHDCVPPIVHRDVKSNNILLDGEFRAKVADFGVAKVIGGAKSMSVIAGSCGYIAPEYAYTLRVNEKSDIYSFGVVILELVTGKLPIDPEFGEKDLVKWICATLELKGMEHVFDPKLDVCFKEEMSKVLNIGLLCANALPINRPSMRRVVKMLQDVSPEDKSDKSEKKNGKLSPYYCEDGSSDQGSVA